jgi:hypothetical protein
MKLDSRLKYVLRETRLDIEYEVSERREYQNEEKLKEFFINRGAIVDWMNHNMNAKGYVLSVEEFANIYSRCEKYFFRLIKGIDKYEESEYIYNCATEFWREEHEGDEPRDDKECIQYWFDATDFKPKFKHDILSFLNLDEDRERPLTRAQENMYLEAYWEQYENSVERI